METTPRTLIEAIRFFSNLDTCHEYMVGVLWPDGKVTCPACGGEQVGCIKARRMFQCKAKGCRKQFSVKVGTIMEDSPLGLDKWLSAMWMIANDKNGVSSYEIHRGIGVTQKTAWFLLHRIRLAMRTGSFQKLSGTFEADETFVGGEARNMHKAKREQRIKGRGPSGKAIVMGILQRKGEVRAKVIPNTKKATVQAEVRSNVEPGSEVFTDALPSYNGLDADFAHQTINHAEAYVAGIVHTNGIENFWSLLKRAIKGTYVSVNAEHLHRYVDEEAYRFNERKDNDSGRFVHLASKIGGKRLTYKQLIGKA